MSWMIGMDKALIEKGTKKYGAVKFLAISIVTFVTSLLVVYGLVLAIDWLLKTLG